jgi:predicted lipid-binding transport protein (Tim44 family)
MFLIAVLVSALGPVLADRGDYVWYGGPGCCCSLIIIGIFFWAIGKFTGEFERGRKTGMTDEEVLDDLPKKKQVMFKGEKVPEWKIAARSKATKAILKFLSYTDNWFERKYIADVADEAFRLVKESIEGRSVKAIERRVTPDLLEEIRNDIQKHRKDRERHIFGRVEVTDVNVLHVEAPVGKPNHTFTALISAKSKDFFEDDEEGEVLKGDQKTYAYQEIWTFRRSEKRWLVELIRPSTDVDHVLEAKNVMAAIELEEFSKDANPEYLKEVVGR